MNLTAPAIRLRPYQVEFVGNLSRAVVEHKRVIACAPTGSGKTKMFISIAKTAMARGRAVIIITETIKIFDQIQEEAGGHEIKAGQKNMFIQEGQLYIAMAQTLAKRPIIIEQINRLPQPAIVIVDEAHIGTPTKLINQLTNALLLGFTATPDWRAAKHLPQIYNECIVACQVDDLIQEGFLCSYKHSARTKGDLAAMEIKGGEFTERSQENALNTSAVFDGIFEDLHKVKFTKCMIFVASIKHCEDMYARLSEQGFRVCRYHSKLENSSYEISKFTKLGMADICVSVGSLTKGFDCPPIDLVILNRATTSLPLYLQMIGRGSRPIPGVKNFFEVIDYGGNWERHGLYFWDRDWNELWKEPKNKRRKEPGAAAIRECPKCESIVSASARICQYCNFEFPIEEKKLAQGELVDITKDLEPLRGRHVSSLFPEELAKYAKIKEKKNFAIRVAKAQEQLQPGWIYQFGSAMGYRRAWVERALTEIPNEPIEYTDIIIR